MELVLRPVDRPTASIRAEVIWIGLSMPLAQATLRARAQRKLGWRLLTVHCALLALYLTFFWLTRGG